VKDTTDTDHDMVIKSLGFQVVYVGQFFSGIGAPAATTVNLGELGVRYWFTRRIGLDAGLGMAIVGQQIDDPNVDDPATQTLFGLTAGMPIALGIYRHVNMFVAPEIGFGVWRENRDTVPWLLFLRGKLGVEFSLGFIDIPRVSLIGAMSLGLRVFNDGRDPDTTTVVFGTDSGYTIEGLFEGSIGLCWYL
jgi:hypothetical protein